MTDEMGLVERLKANGTKNAPKDGDGVYLSICDEAAEAIERLVAQRDEARERVRDMHRRAQRAEGRIAATLFLIDLCTKVYRNTNIHVSTLLSTLRRCLSRRARQALGDT